MPLLMLGAFLLSLVALACLAQLVIMCLAPAPDKFAGEPPEDDRAAKYSHLRPYLPDGCIDRACAPGARGAD